MSCPVSLVYPMTDLQFSISAAYSCIRHPTLAPCHACGEGCRHLFAVNGGEGAAEARLVDGILRAQAEAVTRPGVIRTS